MAIPWILLVAVPFYSVLASVQNSVELYLVTNPTTKELTHISEDDAAALVWNDDFGTNKSSDSFQNDYFFATSPYAILTTKEFFWRDQKFCVNMLVSLCPECQMDVRLMDIGSSKVLAIGRIHGDEHSDPSRLRTWRSMKLNMPLHSLSSIQIKLKLMSITNGYDYTDVLWGIKNLRICDKNERCYSFSNGMKESAIHLPSLNWRKTGPRTKFQKLFLSKLASSVDSSNNEENSDKYDPKPVGTSDRLICEKLLRISKHSTGSIESFKCPNCGQTSDSIEVFDVEKVGLLRLQYEANHITAAWIPPAETNRSIQYYNVSIEKTKSIGCEDFRKDSPADNEKWIKATLPRALFFDLHAYAEYNFTVTAYTTEAGLQQWQTFRTPQLDIPTSVVDNLEFVNKTHLKWDPPNDCSTITGPAKHTELNVWDVGIERREPIFVDQTAHYTYDLTRIKLPGLSPNKKYKICAYVIRDCDKPKNPSKFRCLDSVTLFSFPDTEPIDDRNYIWLVMIPILMICSLFSFLFIWYRRQWKRSVPTSHSQDVPLDPLKATVPNNLEDPSIRSRDDPSDPPYMIPINFCTQMSNSQDVLMAPLYMNIRNNARKQTSNLQNVHATSLLMNITNNRREQISRSRDVPSDLSYMNSINLRNQTNHSRNVPSDQLYTSIPDDLNERTSSSQDVSVAPLYVNMSANSETRSNHMEEDTSEPIYLEIIEG